MSDSDHNLQSFQLAGSTLATMTCIYKVFLDSLIPLSTIVLPILMSSLFLCPFITSGKALSVFQNEMIYLTYLCLKSGNWVLLEQITQRIKWYLNKMMVMCLNCTLNTVTQFYCKILFSSYSHTTLAFHFYFTLLNPYHFHLTPSFSANILISYLRNYPNFPSANIRIY